MSKRKYNYEEDLYEEDDYYDDEDYYDNYEDYEEEEEEKPKKNSKKNNSNKNTSKIQNKNDNQNLNRNKTNQIKASSLNISKKESKTSSLALSPSSSSSISNAIKENKKEEKEKQILSIAELNSMKSYPKIDYGKKLVNGDSNEKPTINLVIIGHVDSGKSTMIGHLLCLLNIIDKKQVHKNLKIKSGKGLEKDALSFAFATDEAPDERERGVTIDIGYKSFSTKNRNVISLDAPGHQDFIPNMIAGTSAADAAILVIDSGLNAFDAGFYREGRTKEHALLAKTLGVSQLIIAINKLELFNWKRERYDQLVEIIKKYLVEELGFDEKFLKFIPISGLTGDNLIKPISSENGKWYKGPTLVDLIDALDPPQRAIDAPVRFIINDISNNSLNGFQGINLFGKLESGIITFNSEYIILPSGSKEKIKTIAVNGKKAECVYPGEQAELLLYSSKNSSEDNLIEPGNVLSSEKYAIPCVKKFKAHIKTYDIKVPISLGQTMMFYLQGQKREITIKKIERIFSEVNGGGKSKNNTRFIPKNFYADIKKKKKNKICAELFFINRKLSTFALRISGNTQAMGYITEFIE